MHQAFNVSVLLSAHSKRQLEVMPNPDVRLLECPLNDEHENIEHQKYKHRTSEFFFYPQRLLNYCFAYC